MRLPLALAASLIFASAARAETPAPSADQPLLRAVAAEVDAKALESTIRSLVGFGTRHTLSDTKSDKRGIGAARRWTKARFEAIGKDCGGCLTIETPAQTVTGKRVPNPTEVMDVLAIQKGTTDPDRVIIIAGHIDSRVTDVMNFTSDAPGANDDGSGVAAVLEAARILSKHRFPATLVYAVLSGEEQGLLGGKVMADFAKARGWKVEADLNNDIVGNSRGISGLADNTHVRIFSEGTKAVETPEQANGRRYNGGEVDSPSRNLARYMDSLADRYLTNFDVKMVYRTDRFGRGGDQVPMLEAGYPAVRVTEAVENYDHQHQDLRTENGKFYGDTIEGVDFAYLAQVTRLNLVTLASLASAPKPPLDVKIAGAVGADTKVSWAPTPGAAGHRVWWRATTEPTWTFSRWVPAGETVTLKDVVIDDYFFGVSSISADGWESPVVYPGPNGAFENLAAGPKP
ncbi:M20/M25/M40 family metallo-hydrolase [uncultured Caulobacter sp.]|uniref:M20/M25/M40 family metallo-hydrolase n=1 Tax=uncultured Caulobacter sp. TaxID=158749 RepID=UPI00262F724B|nr:M20/M25/M40 family metallo-hydrolase [uncultured Caulobacter sp.]